MRIENRDQWKDEVDFLPDADQKIIGTIGSRYIVLVGNSAGDGQIVVAVNTDNLASESGRAVPLEMLLKGAQDPVTIY